MEAKSQGTGTELELLNDNERISSKETAILAHAKKHNPGDQWLRKRHYFRNIF